MTSQNFWKWSSFYTLLIGYIGYYICRGNLPAAFPLLSKEFSFTNEQLGQIAFYSELVYAVSKIINGIVGDKIGGKKIFLLGMLGTIFFNFVFANMSTLHSFILTWCLVRYFLAMGWGGLIKIVGGWFNTAKNATVVGVISISFQFGGVIATFIAGLIIASGLHWQQLFTIPAGLLLIIMLISIFSLKEPVYEKDLKTKESAKEILKILFKENLFVHLLVFSFITTFLRSIFMFWTPKMFSDLGQSDTVAVFKSALFPFLGSIGTIYLGWLVDRHEQMHKKLKFVILFLGLLVLTLLLTSFCMKNANANTFLIFILIGLSGFFLLGPYSLSAGSLTLLIAGEKRASTCAGFIDGVGYLGGALAVWLAGYLSDKLGWQSVFVFLSFVSLMAALSAVYMYVKAKRFLSHRY